MALKGKEKAADRFWDTDPSIDMLVISLGFLLSYDNPDL